MRVLLIEDDKMVGAAVEQALRDAAYAVDWVTDGETAIYVAESEAYEVALLDLGLPWLMAARCCAGFARSAASFRSSL